jgi:hypothetical protein
VANERARMIKNFTKLKARQINLKQIGSKGEGTSTKD